MKSYSWTLVIWWILWQSVWGLEWRSSKYQHSILYLLTEVAGNVWHPSDAKFNGESPNKPMVAVVSSRLTFQVSLTLLDLPLSMFREGLWIIGHTRVSISYKIFASICDCARLMTTILMSVGSTSVSHWSGGHWVWPNRTKKGDWNLDWKTSCVEDDRRARAISERTRDIVHWWTSVLLTQDLLAFWINRILVSTPLKDMVRMSLIIISPLMWTIRLCIYMWNVRME